MNTIILNSKDRVNNTTSANDCEFRVNWGAILDDGKYRVTYSICKQLVPVIPEIPWTFRVKSLTLTVPTIVDGITLTNTNVSMINDVKRGPVFNFYKCTNASEFNEDILAHDAKIFFWG